MTYGEERWKKDHAGKKENSRRKRVLLEYRVLKKEGGKGVFSGKLSLFSVLRFSGKEEGWKCSGNCEWEKRCERGRRIVGSCRLF